MTKPTPTFSLIAPVYNEEQCIGAFIERCAAVFDGMKETYEIVLIDDGSLDQSYAVIQEKAAVHPAVRGLRFARNFGQTAALAAGIDAAQGEFIITSDSDLQNPPEEIPQLIEALHREGVDAVSGWRQHRQDTFITRKIPSWCANRLASWMSGLTLHDYGCALKVYRARFLKHISLYGEMHRFLPALVARIGGRVIEVPVRHESRTTGESKYGLERVEKVFLDLFLLKFMSGFATRPLHFFGRFSIRMTLAGLLVGGYTGYLRYIEDFEGILLLPLVLLTMLLLIVGLQTTLMGVLAEIGIRTYHECQENKRTYFIAEETTPEQKEESS